MRPGLLCPGRRALLAACPPASVGFNEAGAFMPRKGPRVTTSTTASMGFNEAGAFMPRKARDFGDRLIAAIVLQ